MRLVLFAVLLALVWPACAAAHTTAPTGLTVTGTTSSSVTLDWSQDYRDSYSGYWVRVDGGARVKYPNSDGTVSGLLAGTAYRVCVSIDFTSKTHPDESGQACVTATTAGATPTPTPSPTPSPTATPTASPTTTPTATPTPTPTPSPEPRVTWTRSAGPYADFATVKSLGFTHAQVDPDPAQMATVAAAGLRIILWGGNYSDDPECDWNWDDATFNAKMSAAKNSLYADLVDFVFIADEPHGPGSGRCPDSPADMTARHNLSKSWFPMAETVVSENEKLDWPALANVADIFIPIIYPCNYSQTAGAGCNLTKITNDYNTLKAANPDKFWVTVHSFGEPAGDYYRMPTASEEQAMYDRWHALADGDPKRGGWWNYMAGKGCCGTDLGFLDSAGAHLQPVIEAENAG